MVAYSRTVFDKTRLLPLWNLRFSLSRVLREREVWMLILTDVTSSSVFSGTTSRLISSTLLLSTEIKAFGRFWARNIVYFHLIATFPPQTPEVRCIGSSPQGHGQVQRRKQILAKDTDEFTYLTECLLFSLLPMPTKLADGLGLRDVLLFTFSWVNRERSRDLPQELVPPFQRSPYTSTSVVEPCWIRLTLWFNFL